MAFTAILKRIKGRNLISLTDQRPSRTLFSIGPEIRFRKKEGRVYDKEVVERTERAA